MVVDALSIIAHVVSVLAIWTLHRRSKRWQREALELRRAMPRRSHPARGPVEALLLQQRKQCHIAWLYEHIEHVARIGKLNAPAGSDLELFLDDLLEWAKKVRQTLLDDLGARRLLPGEAFELAQGESVQFAGRTRGSDR